VLEVMRRGGRGGKDGGGSLTLPLGESEAMEANAWATIALLEQANEMQQPTITLLLLLLLLLMMLMM
jgi:hypothetical protein